MGKVQVDIEVENLLNRKNKIKANAIVDTGATFLCLPRKMIEELELEYSRSTTKKRIYCGARVFIKDRSATVDVVELDDTLPPLVGVVPLEVMDYVIYPDKLGVFANPEHNGKYMIDLL